MIPGFDDMTLSERREALWGLRDGSAMHMNRVRLDQFEAVKTLITERDLPKSVTHPAAPSSVVRLSHDLPWRDWRNSQRNGAWIL